MKKITSLLLLLAGSIAFSAENLGEWKFDSKKAPAAFFCTRQYVKTEIRDGAVLLTVLPRQEAKLITHAANAGIQTPLTLKQGEEYRLTFSIKADAPVTLPMNVQLFKSPYPVLPASNRMLKVTTDWTNEEVKFHADKDMSGPIRVPHLLLGELPIGTVVSFKDVKLEKLDANLNK